MSKTPRTHLDDLPFHRRHHIPFSYYQNHLLDIPEGGARKTGNNERVRRVLDDLFVFRYHGNEIVSLCLGSQKERRLTLNYCGWHTVSTTSHINGILARLRRDFEFVPYFNVCLVDRTPTIYTRPIDNPHNLQIVGTGCWSLV